MPPNERSGNIGLSLESRVQRLETEFYYYQLDIERQFKANQAHMDRGFAELRKAVSESGATNNPEFRDPRSWILVIIGVIGGGVLFIAALWIATQGIT